MTAKDKIKAIIDAQPDDASCDEIVRERAFERMVEKGLEESRKVRFISNEEIKHRIGYSVLGTSVHGSA